jgi:predicted 3-demethylubiquinone-9 3-methyltransferase (glyoxalase superfamily)
MAASIRPLLMFQGAAAEAMTFYLSLFPDGAVGPVERYAPGEAGTAGTVKTARFAIGGQSLICIDSAVAHDFTFTPAFSLFVECSDALTFDRLASALATGGTSFMPPGDYGFSRRFAWLQDRFGVSWQINLA